MVLLIPDVCNYACGGVLYQIDDNNELSLIGYVSKTLKGAERNYFTTKKELLAIVRCLDKF